MAEADFPTGAELVATLRALSPEELGEVIEALRGLEDFLNGGGSIHEYRAPKMGDGATRLFDEWLALDRKVEAEFAAPGMAELLAFYEREADG
jgi:hypothetical protein